MSFSIPFLDPPKPTLNNKINDSDLKNEIQSLKSANSTLLAERNKLRILLSLLNEGLVVLNDKQQIITINKKAIDILNFSELQVLGSSIDKFVKFYEKTEEIFPNNYCINPKTDQESDEYRQQLRAETSKGKTCYLEIVCTYIHPTIDPQIRWLMTMIDVTEDRKIDDMKLDFVSMAAHELRNPLTAIKGYLSVFKSENAKNFNLEQNTFLDRIEVGVQKLTSLVENLLSVTRIEKGVFTINPEPQDIIPIIKQAIADQNVTISAKGLTLQSDLPDSLPKVFVDKFRISEVLQNLIANAIEYNHEGGKLKIWVDKTEQEIVVNIQDNGQGIPPDALPHLFTKFFRVTGKLSHGSKGTGLGLYITKNIIDMHKGTIKVISEISKGSTFSFTLPLFSPPKNIGL